MCEFFLSIWTFFPIPQGMLLWKPILGKIHKLIFIQHADIPKWIRLLESQFTDI